jgi:hypothetical protein
VPYSQLNTIDNPDWNVKLLISFPQSTMSGRRIVVVYDVVDDDHFETSRYRGSFVMFGKVELPAVPASSQSAGLTSGDGSTVLGL